jgi:hypothetical protein
VRPCHDCTVMLGQFHLDGATWWRRATRRCSEGLTKSVRCKRDRRPHDPHELRQVALAGGGRAPGASSALPNKGKVGARR